MKISVKTSLILLLFCFSLVSAQEKISIPPYYDFVPKVYAKELKMTKSQQKQFKSAFTSFHFNKTDIDKEKQMEYFKIQELRQNHTLKFHESLPKQELDKLKNAPIEKGRIVTKMFSEFDLSENRYNHQAYKEMVLSAVKVYELKESSVKKFETLIDADKPKHTEIENKVAVYTDKQNANRKQYAKVLNSILTPEQVAELPKAEKKVARKMAMKMINPFFRK